MEEIHSETVTSVQAERDESFRRLLDRELAREEPKPHPNLRQSVVIPVRAEILSGNLQSAIESIFPKDTDRSAVEIWCILNASPFKPEQLEENKQALQYIKEARQCGFPVFSIDCRTTPLNIGMIEDLGAQVALSRLNEVTNPHQSVVFLDADSQVSVDYFKHLTSHLRDGANIVVPLQIFVPDKKIHGDTLEGFYRFFFKELETKIITFFETRDVIVEYPGIAIESSHLKSKGGVDHVDFGPLESFLYDMKERKDIVFSPFAEALITTRLKGRVHAKEFANFIAKQPPKRVFRALPEEIESIFDLQDFSDEEIVNGLLHFLTGKIPKEEIAGVKQMMVEGKDNYFQLLGKKGKEVKSDYISDCGRLLGFLKALYAADTGVEFPGLASFMARVRNELKKGIS